MAVIAGSPNLVAAPPPQPLRYGIFTAATVTDDLSGHMIADGFQVPAEDCGVSRLYDSSCPPGDSDLKTFDEGQEYMEAPPYWVYSTRQCGALGKTPAEFSESVRRRFLGGEQTQVEAAFWGGTAPAVDPNLTGAVGVVTVVPGSAGAGAAIAALEESFYSAYGYEGTIHINTAAYAALAYSELITDAPTQGVLRTPIRSRWSIGAGYGITGPAGAAPSAGFVWAFMTPYVMIKRSEIIRQTDPRDFLNRSTNQFMGLAERVYAHTWTCDVVHAVQVPVAAPANAAVVGLPA